MARRSHGCRADLCRGSSRKVPVKSAVHGTRCRSRGLLSWLSWVLCPNSCSQRPADAALLVLWEQSAGRSLPVPPLPLSSYPSLPPSLSLPAPLLAQLLVLVPVFPVSPPPTGSAWSRWWLCLGTDPSHSLWHLLSFFAPFQSYLCLQQTVIKRCGLKLGPGECSSASEGLGVVAEGFVARILHL